MKKLLAFILVLVLLLSFSACGIASDLTGGNNQAQNDGEMVWTVKKAVYTYPNGQTSDSYLAELENGKFTMSYLSEYRKGEVSRSSTIFEYNKDGITKICSESQPYGKEVEKGSEITLTYNADTSTLVKLSMEDGKEKSKDTYVITWDAQSRIAKYVLTSVYHSDYDGTSETVKTYEYAYGADSFTISTDDKQNVGYEDESIDAICRTVTTVPYDKKADIKTVKSYYKMDGTTKIAVGYGDELTEREEEIANYLGYTTSQITYFSNGTSRKEGRNVTFDDQGRVTQVVSESHNAGAIVKPGQESETITTTVSFTYDENGNMTKIERNSDGEVTSYTFEWMKIPANVDAGITMMWGTPTWSVAEFVDNFADFSWEGRTTVRTYQLDEFLTYTPKQ